jgi:hypothetical protein
MQVCLWQSKRISPPIDLDTRGKRRYILTSLTESLYFERSQSLWGVRSKDGAETALPLKVPLKVLFSAPTGTRLNRAADVGQRTNIHLTSGKKEDQLWPQ